MAAVNRLKGDVFVMVDGTTLVTEVLSCAARAHVCFSFISQAMIEHQDMVVGVDITWCRHESDDALLVFCTRFGCVLTTARRSLCFWSLYQFLCNKDMLYVGVHMKDDVEKLRNLLFSPHGFRNVVDLGELASDALHQPRLRAVGVRRLASEILSWPFKSRSLTEAVVSWNHPFDLKKRQIECAAIDAYASYRIGKKLLAF